MRTVLFMYGWQNLVGLDGGGAFGDQSKVYPTPNMEFLPEYWHVCGYNYGFGGQLGWLWYKYATDSSAYVDPYSGAVQRQMQGNPEDWTFLSSPQIWFQGTAAQLMGAGNNRGSGGDFETAGNFEDRPV
jgi:hypothetical protein